MSCTEGHLRIDGYVESCLLQALMKRCLDSTFSVNDDRSELALPDCVPVYCRHEVSAIVHLAVKIVKAAEKDLENLCII